VPFDMDEDWPRELRTALTDYRQAWRAKMDEVNACIEANAEQEELVDQRMKVSGRCPRQRADLRSKLCSRRRMSLSAEEVVNLAARRNLSTKPSSRLSLFLL